MEKETTKSANAPYTGYNISNAQKLQFCKQPFEIIQGQIGSMR